MKKDAIIQKENPVSILTSTYHSFWSKNSSSCTYFGDKLVFSIRNFSLITLISVLSVHKLNLVNIAILFDFLGFCFVCHQYFFGLKRDNSCNCTNHETWIFAVLLKFTRKIVFFIWRDIPFKMCCVLSQRNDHFLSWKL